MKKSAWKLAYIHPAFFKKNLKIQQAIAGSAFRNSTIPANLATGSKIYTYNGAWMLTKVVDDRMRGLKIGEFSITKRFDCQAQNKRKTKRKTKKK